MQQISNQEKQLDIRARVLGRLQKEYLSYEAELQKEKTKLEFLKSTDQSPYNIKKQEEIIGETETVLHDVKSKLIKEKENVIKMLDDVEDEKVKTGEQFQKAKLVVEETEKFIDQYILNQ